MPSISRGRLVLERPEIQSYLKFAEIETDPFADPGGFKSELWLKSPRVLRASGGNPWDRYQLEDPNGPPPLDHPVMVAARVLRMLPEEETVPPDLPYGMGAALAGARWETEKRLLELMTCGLTFKRLTVAGSLRPLGQAEKELAGKTTEAEMCALAVHNAKLAFPGLEVQQFVVHDPKANNTDVINAILRGCAEAGELVDILPLLVCTTQIYWMFSYLEALMIAAEWGLEEIFVYGRKIEKDLGVRRSGETYIAEIHKTCGVAAIEAAYMEKR